MKLMNGVLKRMYQEYAIVFPPASVDDIKQLSFMLLKSRQPQIPADYATFLQKTNGLFWNGLELYATTAQERNKGAFFHTGILQSFPVHADNPLLAGKLVVGMAPEEVIVYDGKTKEYQILDRYMYTVSLRLPRFFDVLYFYAKELIK